MGVDSPGYIMHDLIGYCVELGACYDQLDMVNLASMELLGRLYQLIEETKGSMSMEGFDHFVGRDLSAGLRRGIALAPKLAGEAVAGQANETEILKQRRKAREERALAAAGGKSGGGGGGGGGGNNNNGKKDPMTSWGGDCRSSGVCAGQSP